MRKTPKAVIQPPHLQKWALVFIHVCMREHIHAHNVHTRTSSLAELEELTYADRLNLMIMLIFMLAKKRGRTYESSLLALIGVFLGGVVRLTPRLL